MKNYNSFRKTNNTKRVHWWFFKYRKWEGSASQNTYTVLILVPTLDVVCFKFACRAHVGY